MKKKKKVKIMYEQISKNYPYLDENILKSAIGRGVKIILQEELKEAKNRRDKRMSKEGE